ncbi:chromate transporter [Legionella brunensis]|uniref:Chromate transporter n=1 Tax=Legionella brunensis TaxID=29422 RepID=A0A0W0SK83_9GAMM|nr:chromate transporter [Legionella brunensis]
MGKLLVVKPLIKQKYRNDQRAISEIFLIFLKLGCISFGGPIAHLGYFRDEFVNRLKWLSDHAYADLLETLRKQFSEANISTHSDGETTCCYAKSEKSWVNDPNGIAWEAYHTMEDAQFFSGGKATESSCCIPEKSAVTSCCDIKTTGCCG